MRRWLALLVALLAVGTTAPTELRATPSRVSLAPLDAATAAAPAARRRARPCTRPRWRAQLCAILRRGVRAGQFFDMADVLSAALLYQHHRTGRPVALSSAAQALSAVRRRYDPVRARHDRAGARRGVWNYRARGYLRFWIGTYGQVNWRRYRRALDSQRELASWYDTYLLDQRTARQQSVNRATEAMVASQEAYAKAVAGLRAYDRRIQSAREYSDAVVSAQRTLDGAKAAVAAATR